MNLFSDSGLMQQFIVIITVPADGSSVFVRSSKSSSVIPMYSEETKLEIMAELSGSC